MKFRRDATRLFVRLDTGENVHAVLTALAEKEGIAGGYLGALGAVREVELGYYDRSRRDYDRVSISEDLEIASAAGTLSVYRGKPHVHLHAVLSDRQCRAFGGHVFSAEAAATVEVFLSLSDSPIERTPDEETGLALWRV